jgi:hypothetical protein
VNARASSCFSRKASLEALPLAANPKRPLNDVDDEMSSSAVADAPYVPSLTPKEDDSSPTPPSPDPKSSDAVSFRGVSLSSASVSRMKLPSGVGGGCRSLCPERGESGEAEKRGDPCPEGERRRGEPGVVVPPCSLEVLLSG